MIGKRLGLCGLLMGSLFLVGCGGGSSDDGEPKTPDPEVEGRVPPPDPGSPAADGTTATTVAVSKVFLGDFNPDDTPNPNFWKTLGYNLDGIDSSPNGSNHCELRPGANPEFIQGDGADGIDNGFGAEVMRIITSVAPDASPSLNASLLSGDFSILLHLENLGDANTQTGITSQLYGGALYQDPGVCMGGTAAPCLDGTDVWPVSADSVNGGNVDDSTVKFSTSYMVDGTWVSGSKGDMILRVAIEGVVVILKIRDAIITMDLEGRGTDARATNGVIAGILRTDELIQDLRAVAGSLDESLCEGSTFDSIASQVRAASDIRGDGTNGDASQQCDAISIALGFQAIGVTRGDVAPPVPPADNPCPM